MTKAPPPSTAPASDHEMYKVDSLSRDRVRDNWPQLGDKLRRRWRKLTKDDVLFANGNAEYLAGVLQERYGIDRHEALLQVFEFECDL